MRSYISPSLLLVMTTILGAGIGLAQSILAARLLGPSALGVIGVLGGISAISANISDVRLTDLASKLYFQSPESDRAESAYQVSVVYTCSVMNLGIGALIFSLTCCIALLFGSAFTDTQIKLGWILGQAAATSIGFIGGTLYFLQRLFQRPIPMAMLRLCAQIAGVTVFLPILLFYPSITGYYLATVALQITLAVTALTGLLHFMWASHSTSGGRRWLLRSYLSELRFLWWSNLFGYMKLLHRAADVLFVGWFCSDHVTGIYRFARSLSDLIYVVYDGLNQVAFPRFISLARAALGARYRRESMKYSAAAVLLTCAAILLQVGALPFVISVTVGDKFQEAVIPIAILTLPFIYVGGVFLWTWPVVIRFNKIKAMTVMGGVATLAQYISTSLLFIIVPPSAISAAVGYAVHYGVLTPLVVSWMMYAHADLVRPKRGPSL